MYSQVINCMYNMYIGQVLLIKLPSTGNFVIYKNGQIIAILQILIYTYGQIIAILQIIKIPLYREFLQLIKTAKLLQFCKLQL
jgi:hypothetical protein